MATTDPDREFEATQHLGHRINVLAQAEQVVTEATGMPPAVKERMDNFIDELTAGD